MPPALKFFLGLALSVLLLLAAPFLLERGLRAWDARHDPYTLHGAVVMDAGPARQGLNRRVLNEERFGVTDLGLRLRAFGLPRESAESFARPVRGRVRVLRLGGPSDAAPGPRPPDAPEMGAFAFRLDPISLHAVVPDEPGPEAFAARPAPTPAESFEVLCELAPATPEDRVAADALRALILPAGAACEIDVDLHAPIPISNALEVVYSKPLRSLLRGTALQPLHETLFPGDAGK